MVDDTYRSLRVDGERLWRRLGELAKIGQTAIGGVRRLALSDEDKAGRDLFMSWCRQAGCGMSVDQMGNIFARRAGLETDLDPVLAGSHLDTVPTGGKFDGAYGVLAALEVVETLNDHNISTTFPLEIVSWTNEEGARYTPPLVGSGVFANEFDLKFALSRTDKEGRTFGSELERIGYAGDMVAGGRSFKATFELHIEQGPVLESARKQIGIVTGVQGMRWYEVELSGKEAHAGPTPMSHRIDPVQGLASIFPRLFDVADQHAPDGRVTVGSISTEPGVINTVPGRVTFTVDLRHPSMEALNAMQNYLQEIVAVVGQETGLNGNIIEIWNAPAVAFDPGCIESVRKAAATVGASSTEIVSGAGHDAGYINRMAPTSMIFIPCEDGLSHNELENADKEDVIAGCNVLLHAILDQAI